ncbi:MAG: family 16 glycoside hydrolase [Bryobacteraceae bacterium]
MLTLFRIALCLLSAVSMIAQEASDEAEVRRVLGLYFEALNKGDKPRALELVRENARFFDVTGTPATYEYMKAAGPEGSQNLYEPNRAHYVRYLQFLNPDVALAFGLWRNASAKPPNDSGTFMFALVRKADGWKIESRHHAQIRSPDTVDAGAPEAISSEGILTDQERAGGWRALFDGRSFTGWVSVFGDPQPPGWRIDKGAFATVVGDKRMDMRTKERFESFEFRFEWQIAKGANSGVKYRLFGLGGGSGSAAYEYQLIDEDLPDLDPKHRSGALYGVTEIRQRAAKPVGQWNDARLVVAKDHLEHWLNGIKTAEYPIDVPFASPIVLQHHRSEVRFRNLRIRPLRE